MNNLNSNPARWANPPIVNPNIPRAFNDPSRPEEHKKANAYKYWAIMVFERELRKGEQ